MGNVLSCCTTSTPPDDKEELLEPDPSGQKAKKKIQTQPQEAVMNLTLEDQDDPNSPILPEEQRAKSDAQVPQQISSAPTATLSPVATATLVSGVPHTQNQDTSQTSQVFSPPPPQDLPPAPPVANATTSQPVSTTSTQAAPASVTPTPTTNANTNTNINGSANTTTNVSANGASSAPATANTNTSATSAPANSASAANTLPGILEPQLDQNVDIRTRCRALWDWNADPADDEQISFKAGDILSLIRREDDWYYGENLKNHDIGYFPGNYVEIQGRNWKVDTNRVTPKIISLQQSLMPVSN